MAHATWRAGIVARCERIARRCCRNVWCCLEPSLWACQVLDPQLFDSGQLAAPAIWNLAGGGVPSATECHVVFW